LVGIAVKVTDPPVQIEVVFAVIDTDGVTALIVTEVVAITPGQPPPGATV
jgi:hypothetical protein